MKYLHIRCVCGVKRQGNADIIAASADIIMSCSWCGVNLYCHVTNKHKYKVIAVLSVHWRSVKWALALIVFHDSRQRKRVEVRGEDRKRHRACTTLHARRGETLITANYWKWIFTAILMFKSAEISACVNAHRVRQKLSLMESSHQWNQLSAAVISNQLKLFLFRNFNETKINYASSSVQIPEQKHKTLNKRLRSVTQLNPLKAIIKEQFPQKSKIRMISLICSAIFSCR